MNQGWGRERNCMFSLLALKYTHEIHYWNIPWMPEFLFLTSNLGKIRAPTLMPIAFKIIIVYIENYQFGLEKPWFLLKRAKRFS